MYDYVSVWDAKSEIQSYGNWYCLWLYGFSFASIWTIFVANQMIKYERKNPYAWKQ